MDLMGRNSRSPFAPDDVVVEIAGDSGSMRWIPEKCGPNGLTGKCERLGCSAEKWFADPLVSASAR